MRNCCGSNVLSKISLVLLAFPHQATRLCIISILSAAGFGCSYNNPDLVWLNTETSIKESVASHLFYSVSSHFVKSILFSHATWGWDEIGHDLLKRVSKASRWVNIRVWWNISVGGMHNCKRCSQCCSAHVAVVLSWSLRCCVQFRPELWPESEFMISVDLTMCKVLFNKRPVVKYPFFYTDVRKTWWISIDITIYNGNKGLCSIIAYSSWQNFPQGRYWPGDPSSRVPQILSTIIKFLIWGTCMQGYRSLLLA